LSARDFRISLSPGQAAPVLFGMGHHVTDGERRANSVPGLLDIYVAHGSNEVYYRCPTRRAAAAPTALELIFGNLEAAVERACMARDRGLAFNPEFGLFAGYGEFGVQPAPDFSEYPEVPMPGPWASLTLDEMCAAVRAYGEVVATAIVNTGVEVSVWDIGNEVDMGVAGLTADPRHAPHGGDFSTDASPLAAGYLPPDKVNPDMGKRRVRELLALPEEELIGWLRENVWPYEGKLLAAFAEGIGKVDRQARFSTHLGFAIHRPTFAVEFWRTVEAAGYLPDELGFSFYPSARPSPGYPVTEKPLDVMKETAARMHEAFDRPIYLAEYSYPGLSSDNMFGNWNAEVPGYPMDEDGQAAILRDITAWGHLSGRLSGVRPWGPDHFTGMWGWGPMSLFRVGDVSATQGQARPAIDAVVQGLAMDTDPLA
jgi:arabinogalactan endo-1,4-beta-galactosidase